MRLIFKIIFINKKEAAEGLKISHFLKFYLKVTLRLIELLIELLYSIDIDFFRLKMIIDCIIILI